MVDRVIKDEQPRVHFNCSKCPAFCCSVYERVSLKKRDITRLAKHFGVSFEEARERYTKDFDGERVLRRVKDEIFPETCMFLNQETRGCTIYHARPGVCREYPGRSRCAYYDLMQFERKQQGDESVVPIVTISFREVAEEVVADENGAEEIYEWGDEKKGPKGAKKSPETVRANGLDPDGS
jgi:Fe-S-cluster containining protein